MKRSLKSMLGITLLEIMLVLAIAAMIIVMSVRYYQSASANEKINTALDVVTGVVAGAESYLTANGTISGMTSSLLSPYLSGGSMGFSPWGGTITLTSPTANSYIIGLPSVPASVCAQFESLLKQNAKLSPSACPASGSSLVSITVTE